MLLLAASTSTWSSESCAYANEADEYSQLFRDHLTLSKGKLSTLMLFIELYEVNSTEVNLKYSFIRLCIVAKYINSSLVRAWRTGTETIMLGFLVPEPELDWVPFFKHRKCLKDEQ